MPVDPSITLERLLRLHRGVRSTIENIARSKDALSLHEMLRGQGSQKALHAAMRDLHAQITNLRIKGVRAPSLSSYRYWAPPSAGAAPVAPTAPGLAPTAPGLTPTAPGIGEPPPGAPAAAEPAATTPRPQGPKPPRARPRLGGVGLAVTLGALIAITLVGIWAIDSQEQVLDDAAALPDAPNPENVWIGPEPADACHEDIALEHGLAWTAQGWRAPLSLPEPLLGTRMEGAAYRAYLEEVLVWSSAMQAKVDAMVSDAEQRCAGAPAAADERYGSLYGTYVGAFVHDDRFPVATEVRITIGPAGLSGRGFVETDYGGSCNTGVLVFDHPRSSSQWEDLHVAAWAESQSTQIQATAAAWMWTEGGCPDIFDQPIRDSSVPTPSWDFSAIDVQLIIDPGSDEMIGYLGLGSHAVANVDDFEEFRARR